MTEEAKKLAMEAFEQARNLPMSEIFLEISKRMDKHEKAKIAQSTPEGWVMFMIRTYQDRTVRNLEEATPDKFTKKEVRMAIMSLVDKGKIFLDDNRKLTLQEVKNAYQD